MEIIVENCVSGLPVIDSDGRLVGVISEMDRIKISTAIDVEDAANKVTGEGSIDAAPTKEELSYYKQEDPNLALVGLRIDVERQLRALSTQYGLQDSQPLTGLLRDLESNGKIADSAASGLKKIIAAGNKAAHGATVELDVADWVIKSAPRILAALGGTPCARCLQPAVVNGKCSKCGFLHDGD